MKGLFIALARSPRPEQPNLHSLALSGERRELLFLYLPSSTQITTECSLLALFHPGLMKVEEFSMTIYESIHITYLLTHGLKWKMSNLYRPGQTLLASSVNCNRANYGLSALVFCLRHCSATWRRRTHTHTQDDQAQPDFPLSGMSCICTVYPCCRRTRARPMSASSKFSRGAFCTNRSTASSTAADWMPSASMHKEERNMD